MIVTKYIFYFFFFFFKGQNSYCISLYNMFISVFTSIRKVKKMRLTEGNSFIQFLSELMRMTFMQVFFLVQVHGRFLKVSNQFKKQFHMNCQSGHPSEVIKIDVISEKYREALYYFRIMYDFELQIEPSTSKPSKLFFKQQHLCKLVKLHFFL